MVSDISNSWERCCFRFGPIQTNSPIIPHRDCNLWINATSGMSPHVASVGRTAKKLPQIEQLFVPWRLGNRLFPLLEPNQRPVHRHQTPSLRSSWKNRHPFSLMVNTVARSGALTWWGGAAPSSYWRCRWSFGVEGLFKATGLKSPPGAVLNMSQQVQMS